MPRFDFRCTACQTTFEESIPFGSQTRPTCTSCGSVHTEKLLSAPLGIQFKGSGFYKTDSVRPAAAPSLKAKSADNKTPPPSTPAPDAPAS